MKNGFHLIIRPVLMLDLANKDLTCEDMYAVSQLLKSGSQLRVINLSNNKIG